MMGCENDKDNLKRVQNIEKEAREAAKVIFKYNTNSNRVVQTMKN